MPDFHIGRTKTVLPILIWVGIFLMPLLITMLEGAPKSVAWYTSNFLLTLSICIIYYINYFILVERHVIKHHWRRFIFINILLAIALTLIDFFLVGVIFLRSDSDPFDGNFPSKNIYFFIICFVLLLLAVSLSVAVRMTEYSYNSNIRLADAKKNQAETELANLKNQLNPHFLFNTLNNIYALVDIDKERAKDTVHDLSHLLRYVIYDTSPIKVPLDGELAFIKEYIHIEQLRLSNQCDIQLRLPPISHDLTIAPLLFLPFIENAFKHGISYSSSSFVHIDITLDGSSICCRIANSDHSKPNRPAGIGIQNSTRRLNILYPGLYSLHQGLSQPNVYLTTLNVTLS